MIKLNNPYDEISITRLRRLDDDSPEGETSPPRAKGNETRRTIVPGMSK
eukprot:CAMPEP_0185606038 /NCGR_PEP_ID=MMETSP0436-20130131/4485_1 /TAXON_ID=626734 ORGANISM="Favella taraikaensis, Strain Fe Narragansett Bay" /NCGR_SAMPLE_ID=MMETSP0436 /ASSEMBLY_ACC=CAM_ASM_000390 /LENGTH=48 /DNA_ID= /DNA_START= /DNA_END= /DNA_ORIENTATION=